MIIILSFNNSYYYYIIYLPKQDYPRGTCQYFATDAVAMYVVRSRENLNDRRPLIDDIQ